MDELYHFGIKKRSGRYPWGSGKRPFQSGGGTSPIIETATQREERKKRTISNPKTAASLMEFADELTYDELNNALKRLDLNKKLSEKAMSERKTMQNELKKVVKNVKDVSDVINVGATALKAINQVIDEANKRNNRDRQQSQQPTQQQQPRQRR